MEDTKIKTFVDFLCDPDKYTIEYECPKCGYIDDEPYDCPNCGHPTERKLTKNELD